MAAEDEIKFSGRSENYCVCIIDMVNSTSVTARMTDSQDIKKYYTIFINTMATIARNFEGKVIKNSGDSVVYYFPNTSDSSNECAFRNVMECCLTMIAANTVINDKLYEESLPSMAYRVSADYGRVAVAKSITSDRDDLFGTTINLCAKINRYAKPNTMIIGSDLYLVIKSIASLKNDYELKAAGQYSVGIAGGYPLYSVASRYDSPTIGDFMEIPELKPSGISTLTTTSSDSASSFHNQIENRSELKSKNLLPGQYTVMVVDDDQDILTTFEAILNSQGISVKTFRDANEAIKQFALARPDLYDLIILDIRMPGLNGLQLYYRLKALNKNIKVLFVSALEASDELISILPGIQIENILKKPVPRNYFITTVKGILGVTEGDKMTG
jgi:two-component system, OmpR family, response regulator ChvI